MINARFLAHRSGTPAPVGVLLCNLGTPAAPTPAAVRRYLAEFLSDPRLIELPRWLWLPILYGFVLNFRPRRSAHAYAKVWLPEGSPLHVLSLAQAVAVDAELRASAPNVIVALAMRYGEPSIPTALTKLRESNVQHLLVLPLYPQYSGPATGSIFDIVTRQLQRWRWVPEFRFINGYHDDAAYVTAIANSIRDHWRTNGRARLYFSFHGLPRQYFLAGDPYFHQCHATARLVAAELGLDEREWSVVFQSRFGSARWLEPYTDRTLTTAAREGTRIVDVVCPGFAVDCLETLEEIAMRNRDDFIRAGGQALRYIPALNARPDHVAALGAIIMRNLAQWPIAGPDDADKTHTAPDRIDQAPIRSSR